MSTPPEHRAPATTAPGPSGYAKALVAFAGVASALALALKDDVLSVPEASQLGVAFAAALGVYLAGNAATGPLAYAKGIVAFAGAAAGVLPLYLTGWDGLSLTDWALTAAQIVFAALVVIVPNATVPPPGGPVEVPGPGPAAAPAEQRWPDPAPTPWDEDTTVARHPEGAPYDGSQRP